MISTYAGIAKRSANMMFVGFGVDSAGDAYFTRNTYCACIKLDRNASPLALPGVPGRVLETVDLPPARN